MYLHVAQALAALVVTLAASWFVAGNLAFRANEEGALGTFDWRTAAGTAIATALLAALQAPYLPDPILLGILAGFLAVSVLTDLRLWQIYNALVGGLLVATLVDSIARGRLVDATVGLVGALLVLLAAYFAGILKEGDVKAGAVIGASLGGFYGVVVAALGILGLLVVFKIQQSRSAVPVTTRVPWSPLLAAGTAAALILAATPLAGIFAVSVP